MAAAGWHSSIVLRRAEVAASRLLAEAADFPGTRYLEFGWGDRAFFTAEDRSLGLTMAAAFSATPSVLYIAGFQGEPGSLFRPARLIELSLSGPEFHRLLRSISGDIERGGERRAEPIAAPHVPQGRFYPSQGDFHFFNTCNTWTARKLQAAGLGISPLGVVTTGDVLTRLGAEPPLARAFSP